MLFGFKKKDVKPDYSEIIARSQENLRKTEKLAEEQRRQTADILAFADKVWEMTK